MKETYSAKTPKKIKFGDPWYFKQFSGNELEQLVVDTKPPNRFETIVTLEEFKNENYPDTTIRTMNIYMASDVFMPFYLCGMLFDSQSHIDKNIGVDSAKYYLSIDDKEYTVNTAADGY